jgi:hypothetical protein
VTTMPRVPEAGRFSQVKVVAARERQSAVVKPQAPGLSRPSAGGPETQATTLP